MAKRVYYITALIAFLLGVPILNYFAYSNEIGAITITDKSWTEYCNATTWDNPADILCETYIDFCVNEDTFWYPVNYDPYGRQTPYNFDPAVKEWKLYRSWGKGWRELPMDRPCTGTWCGGKRDARLNVYSVAWRKDRCYKTKVSAIKNNLNDDIFWSFGELDPYWYGFHIIKDCKTKIVYDTCERDIFYYKNYTFINNKTGIDELRQEVFSYPKSYDCNPHQVEYDCITLGIETDKIKVNCPENHCCSVEGTEWCMLDENDGDCNFNAKQHLEKGWSRSCTDVSDLKEGMEISISNFKKLSAKVEKI